MTEFQISDLRLGAGWIGICPMPGRGGHYDADIAKVLGWGPNLVFSLPTLPELVAYGAGHIGEDLADLGITWVHLPMDDFGIPTDDIAARWKSHSRQAHEVLRGGGRVLAHCMGGCGRSGMVLLRLMIEAGEDPAEALVRLRAARACAVETDAQKAWANPAQA